MLDSYQSFWRVTHIGDLISWPRSERCWVHAAQRLTDDIRVSGRMFVKLVGFDASFNCLWSIASGSKYQQMGWFFYLQTDYIEFVNCWSSKNNVELKLIIKMSAGRFSLGVDYKQPVRFSPSRKHSSRHRFGRVGLQMMLVRVMPHSILGWCQQLFLMEKNVWALVSKSVTLSSLQTWSLRNVFQTKQCDPQRSVFQSNPASSSTEPLTVLAGWKINNFGQNPVQQIT